MNSGWAVQGLGCDFSTVVRYVEFAKEKLGTSLTFVSGTGREEALIGVE